MLTLHLNAKSESDPRVMVPHPTVSGSESQLTEKKAKGEWYRVYPRTAQDVIRLQDLEHHLDKHTPAVGGGILISSRAMAALIVIDIRSQKENFFA